MESLPLDVMNTGKKSDYSCPFVCFNGSSEIFIRFEAILRVAGKLNT